LSDPVSIHRDRFLNEWREACRIPSVSGSGSPALEEMAMWVVERMRPLFDRIETICVPGQPPVVVGELIGTGPGKLLIYSHYDVVPPGDDSAWSSPPFGADVRDGAVYARGCCDDKADIVARLHALELWLERIDSRPPYSIAWLCEGAEEIGSPGLDDVLASNAAVLRSDACLWESFLRRSDGQPEIAFGCRGMLAVQLMLDLRRPDQHGAFAPVLRSAPAELVRALASLTNEIGDIVIEGFHDDVVPLSDAQSEAAQAIPLPTVGNESDAPAPYPPELGRAELGRRLIGMPTANISAVHSGHIESSATVVPGVARANVDFALVPDQDPDDIAKKLRLHLDRSGCQEISVAVRGKLSPAAGSLDTRLAHAAITAARETYGEPVVYPLLPGAGPGRLLLDRLGTSIVSPAGTTRPASRIHSVDEHGGLDDYLDHIRFTLRLFEVYADESAHNAES
jgi:acetylornithine deacetylase/succinyl-diaminopimelate desuccinylase-like protein